MRMKFWIRQEFEILSKLVYKSRELPTSSTGMVCRCRVDEIEQAESKIHSQKTLWTWWICVKNKKKSGYSSGWYRIDIYELAAFDISTPPSLEMKSSIFCNFHNHHVFFSCGFLWFSITENNENKQCCNGLQ